MSSSPTRIDGRTLRHRHRRPELLDAAVAYVLEHGLAELSIRPLAQHLGVTHATLLRHFSTKEALVLEVVQQVREDLLHRLSRYAPDHAPATAAEAMWTAWQRLAHPAERRQFALLFEVVSIQVRDPERFGALADLLVVDFLDPIRTTLESHGMARSRARSVATGFLAQVRGLQLDLAVTADQERVDEAMASYIEAVTSAT